MVPPVGLNIERNLDARPLAAKVWIGANGKFVLRVLGLCFDEVFVDAFLNIFFVVGNGGTDGSRVLVGFRQQFYE